MNQRTNNQTSKAMQVKQFLKENLWFLFLLAPLVAMPFLIFEKSTPDRKRIVKTDSHQTVFTKSIEVTSAQVATIVAKPIAELLRIEVYVASQRVAANISEGVFDEQYAYLPQLLISTMENDIEFKLGALNQPSKLSSYSKGHS